MLVLLSRLAQGRGHGGCRAIRRRPTRMKRGRDRCRSIGRSQRRRTALWRPVSGDDLVRCPARSTWTGRARFGKRRGRRSQRVFFSVIHEDLIVTSNTSQNGGRQTLPRLPLIVLDDLTRTPFPRRRRHCWWFLDHLGQRFDRRHERHAGSPTTVLQLSRDASHQPTIRSVSMSLTRRALALFPPQTEASRRRGLVDASMVAATERR